MSDYPQARLLFDDGERRTIDNEDDADVLIVFHPLRAAWIPFVRDGGNTFKEVAGGYSLVKLRVP